MIDNNKPNKQKNGINPYRRFYSIIKYTRDNKSYKKSKKSNK